MLHDSSWYMNTIDVRVGDKLIEFGDGFFTSWKSSYVLYGKKWFDRFLENTDHLGDVMFSGYDIHNVYFSDIDIDNLIVEYVSKNKELLVMSHIIKGGEFEGEMLYSTVNLKYCFYIQKCLEVDYKYRRLRNLEYLDI